MSSDISYLVKAVGSFEKFCYVHGDGRGYRGPKRKPERTLQKTSSPVGLKNMWAESLGQLENRGPCYK